MADAELTDESHERALNENGSEAGLGNRVMDEAFRSDRPPDGEDGAGTGEGGVDMPDESVSLSLINDYDRDSIHTLPLAMMPLSNAALKRARLIKNVRLETRIELYKEAGLGSGQITVEEVPQFFGGGGSGLHDDMDILRELGKLPAFDCYTLRRGLRGAGIAVDEENAFRLSDSKKKQLFPFMRNLTRPLIRHLYGADSRSIETTQDLINALADPDRSATLPKLENLSRSLGVSLDDLPDMLEDFGDTFLSLSYYRSYFVTAMPKLHKLLDWIRDIENTQFVKQTPNMATTVKGVTRTLGGLEQSVTKRFNKFDKQVVINWDLVNLDTFDQVRRTIMGHHASLAEVLCGLMVKIYEWEDKFPSGGGSPDRRCDLIAAGLRDGLDRLRQVERSAPKF